MYLRLLLSNKWCFYCKNFLPFGFFRNRYRSTSSRNFIALLFSDLRKIYRCLLPLYNITLTLPTPTNVFPPVVFFKMSLCPPSSDLCSFLFCFFNKPCVEVVSWAIVENNYVAVVGSHLIRSVFLSILKCLSSIFFKASVLVKSS